MLWIPQLRGSAEWLAAVHRMAAEDGDLEARYLARCALMAVGERVPVETAAVHAFTLRYRDFSCVVEVASTTTLDGLHAAIQRALDWDSDHLWCFYVGGRKDERFTWPSEDWDYQWFPPWQEHEVVELPRPSRIGELGFRRGSKLLYHFDFGDNHFIPLSVRRIGEPSSTTPLPAVVDVKGKRPAQYRY